MNPALSSTLLTRGFLKSGAVRLSGAGVSFLATLMISRWIGLVEFGRFSLALAWCLPLAALALVGSDQLLLREVSTDPKQWRAVHEFSARRIILPMTAAVAVLAIELVTQLGEFLMILPGVVIVLMLNLMRRQQASLWARVGPASAMAGETIGLQAIQLVVAGVAWMVLGRGDALLALAVFATAAVSVAGIQSVALRRVLSLKVAGESVSAIKAGWSKSANGFASVDAILLIYGNAFIVLLGALRAPSEVAIYLIAARLASFVGLPLILISGVLAPSLARSFATDGEPVAVQRIVTTATRIAAFSSICVALGLFVVHPWVLRLFGEGYRGGAEILLILGAANLIDVCCGPVARMLLLSGNEVRVRWAVLRGTLVGVASGAVLILQFGAAGAAVAAAIPLVAWNIEMAVAVKRRLGIIPGPFHFAAPPSAAAVRP